MCGGVDKCRVSAGKDNVRRGVERERGKKKAARIYFCFSSAKLKRGIVGEEG